MPRDLLASMTKFMHNSISPIGECVPQEKRVIAAPLVLDQVFNMIERWFVEVTLCSTLAVGLLKAIIFWLYFRIAGFNSDRHVVATTAIRQQKPPFHDNALITCISKIE